MTEEGVAILEKYFERVSADRQAIGQFTQDIDQAIADAKNYLDSMVPHLGYLDRPSHVMAGSLFACASMLALYLALRDRGMDVHTYGRIVLKETANQDQQPASDSLPPVIASSAAESAQQEKPGEFVYEAVEGDGESFDWGINIKSCAICSLYSKYNAMDLVPYMCASDDVVSDKAGQGLMRTGTIALGAHQCDFRFRKDGDGNPLATQYPEKIQIVE